MLGLTPSSAHSRQVPTFELHPAARSCPSWCCAMVTTAVGGRSKRWRSGTCWLIPVTQGGLWLRSARVRSQGHPRVPQALGVVAPYVKPQLVAPQPVTSRLRFIAPAAAEVPSSVLAPSHLSRVLSRVWPPLAWPAGSWEQPPLCQPLLLTTRSFLLLFPVPC